MRYLVSGYYGEGNLGDEAVLAGILQEVSRHDPEARFTILSFAPEDTRRRHGVKALSTSLRDPETLLAALGDSDLLISGGGSFLHEADFDLYGRSFLLREGKLRPVPYFLSVIFLARARGLPVLWYAQGLGPLHTRTARCLVALAAARSQAVTWRDRDSAELAARIGARAPLELVVPDPAYALEPLPPDTVAGAVAAAGVPAGRPYLAACPRPWLGRTGYRESLTAALARVGEELDLHILLVPLQERTDGPLCQELAADPRLTGRASVLRGVEEPAALAGILGGAALCVTMRLHAGILAASAGAPAAVIDYDPKVRAFARQTGQEPWTVRVDDLESPSGEAALIAAALDTARRRGQRRAAVARHVAPLRREAGRTARLAVLLAAVGARGRVSAGPHQGRPQPHAGKGKRR